MAALSAAAKAWRPGAVALLRLEAALVGLVCFAAGAVPRLLPALLGLLGVVAASPCVQHRPGTAAQAAAQRARYRASRLQRLSLHQRGMVARPVRRLHQGRDRARAGGGRLPHQRVLFPARGARGARAGEVGARGPRAWNRLPPDRGQFRRADRALPDQSRRPAVRDNPQEDQGRRGRGNQDLGLRAQPQRHQPRPVPRSSPASHRRAGHGQCAAARA